MASMALFPTQKALRTGTLLVFLQLGLLLLMRCVIFAAAPADALIEARNVAHYVTTLAGGRGAVREVCDLILKGRGLWDEVADRYEL